MGRGNRSKACAGITKAEFKRRTRTDKNGCWIWQRAQNESGYGTLWFWDGRERLRPDDSGYVQRGSTMAAHRVAWLLFRGAIPPGMFICHRCDVKACVNPAHLFLGTPNDNVQDAKRKGRLRLPPPKRIRGELATKGKLLEVQVLHIRWAHRKGASINGLARVFRVSVTNIRNIVRRKVWRHV